MISIYIYENLINGKVYIGQTPNLLKKEREYIFDNIDMSFGSDVKKYGIDNFSIKEITAVDTKDQANYTKIDWIARAKELLGKENVYNINDKGHKNQ